jgi:phosphoserine aminotransferase
MEWILVRALTTLDIAGTSMTTSVADRVFNFSPGPAVLPLPVLKKIQAEMLALPGAGASILEISHRSKAFISILDNTKASLRRLLNIPENYDILFLQGGARLQFSMIAMNLLRGSAVPAQYLVTGSWGKYAVEEAKKEGPIEVIWDGKKDNYNHLPAATEYSIRPDAPYVHITSNETIQGVQFQTEPNTGDVPLVCDSSSDFLYRPIPVNKYGIVYACAQKNAGPAGVTVVIIRKDLLERSQDNLPGYLNYKAHSKESSLWNTPPTFGVYVVGLVCQWLENDIGGLAAMHALNQKKAALLYDVVDRYPELYQGHAAKADRSLMNVTFRLPSEEKEKAFLSGAAAHKLDSLQGHRSVGGIRASIYNAMPMEGVETLANYMTEFAKS